MAGEFWIQLFGSCVAEQEPTPRRPRIDRSQIGQPMNFRHTGHVGSTDLGSISTLQTQMKGKGGEPVHIQVPHIMNARAIHEIRRTSIQAWSWHVPSNSRCDRPTQPRMARDRINPYQTLVRWWWGWGWATRSPCSCHSPCIRTKMLSLTVIFQSLIKHPENFPTLINISGSEAPEAVTWC